MKIGSRFLFVVGLLLGLQQNLALAGLTGVNVTPSFTNCALGTTQSVDVRWDVSYIDGNSDVFSEFATLRAGVAGPVLATIARRLNRFVPAGSGNIVFRERIVFPEQAIVRAQQLGFTKLTYTRDFEGMVVDSVTCNITGSAGAGQLNLSRIGLRFPDNSRVKVMANQVRTHILADLTFAGAGRLEALWEIADPSSTSGNPSFRTMQLVRRSIVGAGQQLTIRSPDLPTHATGIYLVRFRVTSPALGFDSPVIRYWINPAMQPHSDPVELLVNGPPAGKTISTQTEFSWQPVPGAAVYQLELLVPKAPVIAVDIPSLGAENFYSGVEAESADDSYPVAGILVGGSTEALSLSAVALSRVPTGVAYLWRVHAYDKNGQLIGVSKKRLVHFSDDFIPPKRTPLE